MADSEKSLEIAGSGSVQKRSKLSNTIVFPKELREAIPVHSARVLEFDRVTGAANQSWAEYSAPWLRARGVEVTPRAQLKLLAHETGKLNGQFEIGIDLDAETMRALGQFLIDLANRADPPKG
jgi:hypothetical protein